MNPIKVGWFTTARDEAALALLQVVYEEINKGFLNLEIPYVFVSKERDESSMAELFIDKAEREMRFKVLTFSALRFRPELRKENIEQWRTLYHREVLERLTDRVDFGMLAGYMWVVSSEFCEKIPLLNLHPALPGGPKGTWQEVIWQLISARSAETGVMIHRVTPELDEGPPLTFVRFPIKTSEFNPLWEDTEKILLKFHLKGLKEKEGEKNTLFSRIREEGVKRELPLIILTLKYLSEGKIRLDDEALPYDLSKEVENYLKAL
ncbi:MAG: formyltransferase family protein [Caldimicrobium sp.]|nr:formyl transferase [Caldimicrobium sp.]MCX7613530.1 formyltransferase family protein [Caldimicrobium sp.]MDW8182546.1 formyltransferase family protein [Caldimicrobium sp.]